MTPQSPLRAVRVHANAREFKLHALLLLVGRNSRSVGPITIEHANLNLRAFAWTLTARSGVCGVTDQRFHNSREMFEFYATKSCLFLLKAMHVMEIYRTLWICWFYGDWMRYLVVAERIVKSMRGLASASLLPSHYLYSVCHTLSRGFLKLALTGPRRLESQRNVKYTFYLRQVNFFFSI